MVFSDSSLNQGIVQQVRSMMRVDSTQWPTAKIVASVNNYLDTVTGYAIGADRTFQWDDTNHTALPEGTTNIVSGQSDYSFLTDQQGNTILTLTGMSRLISGTSYEKLYPVDRNDTNYDVSTFGVASGTPTCYDKIADNIIRLDVSPSASVTSGLKFHFQRTPSYFLASDTTKSPGVAPILHRGFVIAAAYDGALTLGLANLQALATEMQREEQKMVRYFADRGQDSDKRMTMSPINFR
jgi:hypothetical protein